jgi:hypothetical protein
MARSLLACAVLTPVLIAAAGAAVANETRCVRGDDAVRRVAVEAPDRGVPCEVVYWKDTEAPGVRSVLWSAETDADFCARKAEELVETLAGGGWSCSTAGEQPRAASREAPAAEPSPPAAAPSPPAAAPSPPAAAPSPPAAAPSPSADSASPSVAEDRPQPPAQGTDDSEAASSVRAALAPPHGEAEADGDAAPPAGTALDAIIEQNLVRLNDGVDGRFAAEIAEYGDLDGDGRDDGLVFFTYESQRLGKARFVAAYLFDGESYALAATKPLAGSDDGVQSAEIESIEDGVISLRLNVLEPGDAACCPSGLRRQELVLRGGQLVEARSASGTDNRS